MDKENKTKQNKIDLVCLIHGKKMSEHELGCCLFCCLCFKSLTSAECNVTEDGKKEDVCKSCAEKEKKYIEQRKC